MEFSKARSCRTSPAAERLRRGRRNERNGVDGVLENVTKQDAKRAMDPVERTRISEQRAEIGRKAVDSASLSPASAYRSRAKGREGHEENDEGEEEEGNDWRPRGFQRR